MILINNVLLPLNTDFENLKPVVAKELKTDINNIINANLYRKSVDARKKDNIVFCCSITVNAKNEQQLLKKCKNATPFNEKKYNWEKAGIIPEYRPVVIGFGPAGMFSALTLAKAGLMPFVLERGADVDTRTKQVEDFFADGKLNFR